MTRDDASFRISVTPLAAAIAGPLVALLLSQLGADLVSAPGIGALYRARLGVALAALVATSAIGLSRSAKRVTVPLTRSGMVVLLVACSVATATGAAPGSAYSSLTEAVGAMLGLSGGTAVVLLVRRRQRPHAALVFWSIVFSASTAAAWCVAVPPIAARLVILP